MCGAHETSYLADDGRLSILTQSATHIDLTYLRTIWLSGDMLCEITEHSVVLPVKQSHKV